MIRAKRIRLSRPALLTTSLLLGFSGGAVALSPQPNMHIVLFGFNSVHIDAAGREVIEQVVSDVRAHKYYGDPYAIAASGHADRAGPPDHNLALSLRRAEAVRDALVAAGIPADAITIAGRGETEPAVPTPDGASKGANRRVVIDLQ